MEGSIVRDAARAFGNVVILTVDYKDGAVQVQVQRSRDSAGVGELVQDGIQVDKRIACYSVSTAEVTVLSFFLSPMLKGVFAVAVET